MNKLIEMLTNANSYYAILLLVIFLSCRSEARDVSVSEDVSQVEATIGNAELSTTVESADVELLDDSKLVVEDEIQVSTGKQDLAKEVKSETIGTPTKTIEPNDDPSISVPDLTTSLTQEEETELVAEEIPIDITNEQIKPLPSEVPESKEVVGTPDPIVEEATVEPYSIVANIHDAWDGLLKKYVTAAGFVDYKGMMSESEKLEGYLNVLASNQPKDSDLSQEAMAYYINVYNAATVKLILDNYPTTSIKGLNGGKPWDKVWIKLGGKTYSLNNIEHDILRPRFKDSRVHFAVNCASASCPKIANRAFYGSDLEMLLEKLTREFVNDDKLNTIKSNAVELSKIFQWYQGDFPNVIDFVNQYSDVKVSSSAKKTYKDYKWNLNGK